jgi:hypothetical protein
MSRRLTGFSGIGSVPHVVDVWAIGLEPVRVSIAQLALLQRPALAIGVPGEPCSSGAAAADAALCRVPAGEQLDLFSHALFFLEARIVGGDTPFPWVGAVSLAFLPGREISNPLPSPQSCSAVLVDGMSVEVRHRRLH